MGKPVPRATVKTQRPTATAKKVSGGPAVPKGSAADRGAERSAADDDGKKKPFEVKIGDRVLISKYGGTEIKIDGNTFQVLREDDILGILA